MHGVFSKAQSIFAHLNEVQRTPVYHVSMSDLVQTTKNLYKINVAECLQ